MGASRWMGVCCVLTLLAVLGGCTSGGGEDGGGGGGGGGGGSSAVRLKGAGASFPARLYTAWFEAYGQDHPKTRIEYASIGSGGGIKSVIDDTVDFGASDAAMKPEEMEKVDKGVQLLPMTAGGVVLAYNLDVENLKLSRETYVGIFLGKITKWNDPAIAKDNPDANLPDQTINVVVRSDSSGTTFVFTKHLAAISEEFKTEVGEGKSPSWPVGTKSKGSEGVTTSLQTTPGSIGYVDFGHAQSTKELKMASLQNKDGEFVAPTIASAKAALAAAEMPDDLIVWMPDPEGAESYPIVTYTWVICYKTYDDAKKVEALKDVLTYCLTEGQKSSEKLGYIPLPESVVTKVTAALDNITVAGS